MSLIVVRQQGGAARGAAPPSQSAIRSSSGRIFPKKIPKKGVTLALADAIAAATALTKHLTLVTYNTSHYPMSDLQTLSPTK